MRVGAGEPNRSEGLWAPGAQARQYSTAPRSLAGKERARRNGKEARGRASEEKRLQLLRAGRRRNRTKDPSRFFCSELVAEAYQRMGLLPPKPPSNNYTPSDFSSEGEGPLPPRAGS